VIQQLNHKAIFLERQIQKILNRRLTLEGAGVKLKRVLGNDDDSTLDPFLLLDHFGSDNPQDYIKGFPWHPHRGMETVTYMWTGEVEHGDSMGNKGVIKSGDVQWMTAGSGIIHQEMPQKYDGLMQGFQLWINLPAKKKMVDPKYRGIVKEQIPMVQKDGVKIKVIAGKVDGTQGPIRDLAIDIEYFDVKLASGKTFEHTTTKEDTVFAYIVEGSVEVQGKTITQGQCVVFGKGDFAKIDSKNISRFLFVSGEPLNEPVAWRGPIVMNTQEELDQAFEELDAGTFIKTKNSLDPKQGIEVL
jgi:redox-sensitive bicupin YhaK (pirin superfamily)